MPRWVTVFGRVNHLGAEPGTRRTLPRLKLWNLVGLSVCLSVYKFVCLTVCLSVCLCAGLLQKNQPISVKIGVMIGPTSPKDRLSFGDDAIPDTDFRSLFHFPHHCGTADCRSFISMSTWSRSFGRRMSFMGQRGFHLSVC